MRLDLSRFWEQRRVYVGIKQVSIVILPADKGRTMTLYGQGGLYRQT